MFESKLQRSWREYKRDYAFTRIAIWVCFFQVFLTFISMFLIGQFDHSPLYIVGIAFIFINLIQIRVFVKPYSLYFISILFLTLTILGNYLFVGKVAKFATELERFDLFFANIDIFLFNKPISLYLNEIYRHFGSFTFVIYDFLQLSYMTYFFFPLLGSIFYFRQLDKIHRYRIGRFFSSMIIFFCLNYLLYLIVPVSGPIYYLDEVKNLHLEMSYFGNFLNQLVARSHPNYIDCFPSGHTGISVLVTYWMFKIKNHFRYIFLIFCLGMIFATMSLKYHYFLDVICALPFSILCFKLGYLLVPTRYDIRKLRRWKI